VARASGDSSDLGAETDLPVTAPRATAPPPAPAAPAPAAPPSQTIISPAGGHAPIHPIQTTSPYDMH
jgi:hypothetical protein